jgi:hypothetical protein
MYGIHPTGVRALCPFYTTQVFCVGVVILTQAFQLLQVSHLHCAFTLRPKSHQYPVVANVVRA